MENKALFIVKANVKPEQEDAFNRWYDEDHMPKALNRFPGVISGRRYKIMDGGDGYRGSFIRCGKKKMAVCNLPVNSTRAKCPIQEGEHRHEEAEHRGGYWVKGCF